MKNIRTTATIFALATILLCGLTAQTASAQNVDARLSTREAYVGMPVILQISIVDASDFQQPSVPEIDGCDVRSLGAPSQSSQITIINGRRSESRSVTMQYQVTPRRAGTFEIPPLTINVNGRNQKTQPLRFVTTKSETGDLLFAEIAGGKDKVFVGQPLDLTLKIWVKPYADREKKIRLSEANMWQMISQQTSWGSFSERLKELAENNQRPGGREVLRADDQGIEHAYYLYEIGATVYPKRPGKIDADDVQIVVNYPTALGKSRDPFESFFKDSPFGRDPFGGNSRLSQLMDDDFLASPFGNRLTVSSVRPIVAEATVDSTEVVPIPTTGRPADYRGAVGRYKIATQATPTTVAAGDPITLNIGIAGTGPMELVQAPPLSELTPLTTDFKVADQSLAGFVQDKNKVFSTTIRPRREGITTIPSIPFSFFDPDTEIFETVMSEPISITVNKSESLAMDSIVGNARRSRSDEADAAPVFKSLQPNFANDHSASVLLSQSPSLITQWWLALVVLPPLVWLMTLIGRSGSLIAKRLPSFKSAKARCRSAIERAKTREQIERAVINYSSSRSRQRAQTANEAVGALRISGLCELANDVEAFFQANAHSAFSRDPENSPAELQQSARELTDRIESSFATLKTSHVRRANRRTTANAGIRNTAQKASILLLAGLIAASASGTALAEEVSNTQDQATFNTASVNRVELSKTQQETILKEAGEIYSKATAVAETDSAEANTQFTAAAEKYQLLVDSGIHNSVLYTNLGNAYLQINKVGLAIANYERARILDPDNRQLKTNLDFANSRVKEHELPAKSDNANGGPRSLLAIIGYFRTANDTMTGFIGTRCINWTLAIASLVFWGLLTAGAWGYRFPMKRLAIVPLILLILSGASYGLTATADSSPANGIIVANDVTLHSGDGEQFAAVISLETAEGQRVEVLTQRGDWTKIRTATGHSGWIKGDQVVNIRETT